MRIIAGTAKGRRLATPKTEGIRPTGSRVREALFSMLGDLEGVSVVDAFAGSGALGLEALSRGASLCYFFDPSRAAIALVKENVARLDMTDRAEIIEMPFRQGFGESIADTPDLWFFDPPYGTDLARQGLAAMAAKPSLVTEGALVVWESDADEELIEHAAFERCDCREYGRTRLAFYRRRAIT